MKRDLAVMFVLALLLVLGVSQAWADTPAVACELVLVDVPEIPGMPGARVVYETGIGEVCMERYASLMGAVPTELVLRDTKQVVIPDDVVEFSLLVGTSFPSGVWAGCASVKAAEMESGKAAFFADLGLQVRDNKLSPILGASIRVLNADPINLCAGAGVRFPEFRFKDAELVLYTRIKAW